MAFVKHYETVDYKVTSNSADTEAILYVQRKSDDVVAARLYVEQAGYTSFLYPRATDACDRLQALIDDPPDPSTVPDWAGGKVSIGGLPVI